MVVDHPPRITDRRGSGKLHPDRVFIRGGFQPSAEALIKVYLYNKLKSIRTRTKIIRLCF